MRSIEKERVWWWRWWRWFGSFGRDGSVVARSISSTPTSSNWEHTGHREIVASQRRPHFRCGHCKKLAPEWKRAANNLKGKVKLGQVDCDSDKSAESEELSARTKRMSIEIGPSSFASRKKKSRKNTAS
ncbi:hypothetical protein LWI29_026836 [Acer saccharum]|uniref:Thioredoxin domain-containing protein n=1 Tax=Acer saccharum TaxID=4024 RepID=A0AA39SCX6_ACESA|nr:hypothetical protein LWI29_026836 [Acer saccharum]